MCINLTLLPRTSGTAGEKGGPMNYVIDLSNDSILVGFLSKPQISSLPMKPNGHVIIGQPPVIKHVLSNV